MPVLTASQLNRSTLQRQLLLERAALDPSEAIHRIAAVQAQAPASPYIGLHARLTAFDPADLDEAISSGALTKATLMRITLHLVSSADHLTFNHAMQPTLRSARLQDARVTRFGLTPEQIDGLIPTALSALSHPLSNAAIVPTLSATDQVRSLAGADADPTEVARWAWWAIRHVAPVRHHPTGGPWSFADRPSFAVSGTPALRGDTPESRTAADSALAGLIRRYLAGFGPASVADIAQFALVQRRRIRPVLESMRPELREYAAPCGPPVLDLDGLEPSPAEVPAPVRLLPMWDSTMLAYQDRSRILPEAVRRVVIRANGDTLPTVLVDGHVAGVWRGLDVGDRARIEVTLFQDQPRGVWEDIAGEAHRLADLLSARDREPYRRYHRWWAQLPAAATTHLL